MSQENEKLEPELERYARQIRFPGMGIDGQRKLLDARVLLVGCGALGSVIANTLVREGVGFIRIVDRDFLEMNNLQRQVLFDEEDVKSGLPKAIAAANKLRRINSAVEIEAIVSDVNSTNINDFAGDVQMVLDGTDNFETRFLINDFCVKNGLPWTFGGCLGMDGQTLTIVPGETPCLSCLMQDGPPPPGTTPTCDSFGILSPVINLVAAIECAEAIKILSGNIDRVNRKMMVFSLWENHMRQLEVSSLREGGNCPTCQQHDFAWLEGRRGSSIAVLCGRNAVQLKFPDRPEVDLASLGARLSQLGSINVNEFLLRFSVDDYTLTVFEDGRAIIGGTDDVAVAKKLYAQYIGS
ncbi:MAG: ThiF family adenylyltransferase [Planctomycetota bacterium]